MPKKFFVSDGAPRGQMIDEWIGTHDVISVEPVQNQDIVLVTFKDEVDVPAWADRHCAEATASLVDLIHIMYDAAPELLKDALADACYELGCQVNPGSKWIVTQGPESGTVVEVVKVITYPLQEINFLGEPDDVVSLNTGGRLECMAFTALIECGYLEQIETEA